MLSFLIHSDDGDKENKREKRRTGKGQAKRTRQQTEENEEEQQGVPVLRDTTETANILAKVNKKPKLSDGDPRAVHLTANQPDDTDKVTSMFCTVCRLFPLLCFFVYVTVGTSQGTGL